MNQINNRRMLSLSALVVSALALPLIFLTVWSNSQFRVVKTSPEGKIASSSSLISIDFNRILLPADQQPDGYIQIFPQDIDSTINVGGDNISLSLNGQPEVGSVVTVVLQNITAQDGSMLSHKLELPVEYIEFKNLDIKEQQVQISESAVAGDNHPLLSVLPYDNLLFHIDSIIDEVEYGKAPDWKSEKDNFIVLIDVFALKGSLDEKKYQLKVLELRGLAEKWILEETGVDPKNDINILFSPSDGDIGIGEPEIFGD